MKKDDIPIKRLSSKFQAGSMNHNMVGLYRRLREDIRVSRPGACEMASKNAIIRKSRVGNLKYSHRPLQHLSWKKSLT